MKKRIATLAAFISAMLLCVPLGGTAAALPYDNYTYDREGKSCAEPDAYAPTQAITGASAGTQDFKTPQDLFVAPDGRIYVADTGNDRIVVLGGDYTCERVIDSFVNGAGTDGFSAPSGVYVTDDGRLYVADTGHARIVQLAADDTLVSVLVPEEGLLDFSFSPVKVAADRADRMYIVSRNCTQGVMEFDRDGSFLGYYGAVKTQISPLQAFWKAIATDAQKAAMDRVIPTEYSNIDLDEQAFVFGTVSAIDTDNFNTDMFVHRLNPMGKDVLKRNGFAAPMGDVEYVREDENGKKDISQLCDVAAQANGVYSVLDANKGRVFTYDATGELLYIYGGIGDELGTFAAPVAIDVIDDNRALVLDSQYGQIVEFAPTRYAAVMLQAIEKNAAREYDAAAELWREALKYTSESAVVFRKMGDVYNSAGEYRQAMTYYKLAYKNADYSEAYQSWRMAFLSRYFGWGMGVLLALIAAVICRKIVKVRRRKPAEGGQRR